MRERPDTSAFDLDVEAFVDVLEDAPVTLAILFGSRARSTSHGSSDVDLAVEFSPSLSSVERTRVRMDLISELSRALDLDAVDVVPLSAAPTELRREIQADGIILYGDEPDWFDSDGGSNPTHEETLARFDEIVDTLERVV
jgi:predicted nucleotidyltransferase